MDMQTPLIYYLLAINIITFFVFGFDKNRAKRRKKRVSEIKLFFLTAVGGTVGAIAAMFMFNHKKSKPSFVFKTVLIVGFQLFMLYYLLYR